MGENNSPELLVQLLPHKYVLPVAPHGVSYAEEDSQQSCGAFGKRI